MLTTGGVNTSPAAYAGVISGTVRAFSSDGSPLNWFDGFRWRIEGDRLFVEHPGRKLTITHSLTKDAVLHFESEGFGSGKRLP